MAGRPPFDGFNPDSEDIESYPERLQEYFIAYDTGLPSSVCVVGCAFIMSVSVYQISKTEAEI